MKSINFLKVVLLTIALVIGYTVATYAQTCTPRFVSNAVNGKRGTLTGMPTQLLLPTFGSGVDTLKFIPDAYLTYIRVSATDSLCLVNRTFANTAEGDQLIISWFASGATRKLKVPTSQFTTISGLPYFTATSGEAKIIKFVYNCADGKWIEEKGN